ncbi:MAG: YbgC/FadM family acyl-CoA thioesterase [Thermodesulfovibrionales bacterium]
MSDCIDIKMYYEDTDCGGVVYYGKYLGYLERARTEYLEDRKVSLVALMKDGVHFVVVNVDINYKTPAKYGDVLAVCSEVVDMTNATITFGHKIFKKATETVVATASVKLACIGKNMRPKRISSAIVNALRAD